MDYTALTADVNNEVYSHKSSTCRSIKGNKTTKKTDRRTETYFNKY